MTEGFKCSYTQCFIYSFQPLSSEGLLFILLSSEKNEPRSAAVVIGLARSAAAAAVGGCGTRFAQTVLAPVPPPAGALPAR